MLRFPAAFQRAAIICYQFTWLFPLTDNTGRDDYRAMRCRAELVRGATSRWPSTDDYIRQLLSLALLFIYTLTAIFIISDERAASRGNIQPCAWAAFSTYLWRVYYDSGQGYDASQFHGGRRGVHLLAIRALSAPTAYAFSLITRIAKLTLWGFRTFIRRDDEYHASYSVIDISTHHFSRHAIAWFHIANVCIGFSIFKLLLWGAAI